MISTDKRKALNALLYVAGHFLPAADVYKTLKILYFADRLHLKNFGRLIYGEEYYALQHGPVPECAYHFVKVASGRRPNSADAEMVASALVASVRTLTPRRDADLTLFSRGELACMNAAINEYAQASFDELKSASHDAAFRAASENGEISLESLCLGLRDEHLLRAHIYDPNPGVAHAVGASAAERPVAPIAAERTQVAVS